MAMITTQNRDITKGWIYDAEASWPPDLVQKYCVQDEEWQGIRLSMKGVPTHEKLAILKEYYERKGCFLVDRVVRGMTHERYLCQVDNYLGALRRGGQLDMGNMIRKYI